MGAQKLAPDTGKWGRDTGALGQVSMRTQKGVFEPPMGGTKVSTRHRQVGRDIGALGQVSMRAQKGVFEPPSGVEKRALPTSPVNMPNAGALAENKCKGRAPMGAIKR